MNRVRERREELGMKQKELLALLRETDPRMDIGTLSRIENGYVLPASEEIIAALERHLQAARDDLFDAITVFAAQNAKRPKSANTGLVASVLGYGKANAVPRAELAERLGVKDRSMRMMLEAARQDGLVICCDQDSQGYYMADTPDEYRRQYQQNQNRAMSILRQQKYIREGMVACGSK